MSTATFRKSPLFRSIALIVLTAFSGLLPAQPGYAQVAIMMPPPGQMIHITNHFEPPQMIGLKVDMKDPFSFDFIMDQGQTPMSDDVQKEEFNKIVKYFLVSLAMPNKNMWVNLSPYESKRIIPEIFAQTEMGRDLLAQDYVLKQFTASLMYPEDGLGKKFWDKVYQEAQVRFGTAEISVNTFNKVWIVADHADIYQKDNTAFLVGSHLKVMLEQDYMAIEKNKEMFGSTQAVNTDETMDAKTQMASELVREIIIPAIEKEVNEGQSFAAVRQVYNAEIMATWFKRTLRESLLGQVFADKSKISGQRVSDPQAMEKIYHQYLRAYKKGVFNYIREDATPDGQTIPRKYFSGGLKPLAESENDPQNVIHTITPAMMASNPQAARELVDFAQTAAVRMKRYVLASVLLTSLGGLTFGAGTSAAATEAGQQARGIPQKEGQDLVGTFHGTAEVVANLLNAPIDLLGVHVFQTDADRAREDRDEQLRIVDDLRSQIASLQQSGQAAAKVQDQLTVAQAQLKSLEGAYQKAQAEFEAHLKGSRQATADLQGTLTKVLAKWASIKNDLDQKNIELQKALSDLKAANVQDENKQKSLEDQIQKNNLLMGQLNTATTKYTDLQTQYQQVSGQLQTVTDKVGNRDATIAQLGAENIRNKNLKYLLVGASALSGGAAALALTYMSRKRGKKELQEALDASNKEKDRLQASLDEKTSQTQQEIDRLIRENAELKRQQEDSIKALGVAEILLAKKQTTEAPIPSQVPESVSPKQSFTDKMHHQLSGAELPSPVNAPAPTPVPAPAVVTLAEKTAAEITRLDAIRESERRNLEKIQNRVMIDLSNPENSTIEKQDWFLGKGRFAILNGMEYDGVNHEDNQKEAFYIYKEREAAGNAFNSQQVLAQIVAKQEAKLNGDITNKAQGDDARAQSFDQLNQKLAGLTTALKTNPLGGINLSDEHLIVNIKVDGEGMPLPAQFQDQAMTNLNGLTSIIRKITPLTQQNAPELFALVQ